MENDVMIVEQNQEQTKEIATFVNQKSDNAVSIWNDTAAFEATQRMAKLLANSGVVPQQYQGKIADCVIAIDIARRMNLPPISVMQGSQVVYGNFSWQGKMCKSMIDNCGRYKNYSRYVEIGERGKDTWGYYLEATEKDNTIVKGPAVTIQMAKDEGWYGKNGSKWKTMPELMLKYRAAAFFMRTECAGLSMGFLTAEEHEDIAADNGSSNLSNLLDSIDEEQ